MVDSSQRSPHETNNGSSVTVSFSQCLFKLLSEAKADGVSDRALTGPRSKFYVYHLVIVGLIGFLLGGVVCVGVFLYCQRARQVARHQKYADDKYSTLSKKDVQQNIYMSPSQMSMNTSSMNNRQYYSQNSLTKKHADPNKMTVKEATLKRNSLMRTNLSLNDL